VSSGVAKRPSIRPRKSLGQHFLRDTNVARRIVDALEAQPGQLILEIGPGTGALTSLLNATGAMLVLVELDPRAAEVLRSGATGSKLELIEGDILSTNLAAIAERSPGGKMRVVGNIPYNITSPILFHILDNRHLIIDATLMMQREVARRLVAGPRTKEYGILSIFTQFYTHPRVLFDVSPRSFVPAPTVTSTVVHLEMRSTTLAEPLDEGQFRRMVRGVFSQRRKTLRNSLRTILGDRVRELPQNLPLEARPEELTVEELVQLSNAVVRYEATRE
jgi:16S rRNA (adenine1518-N6/adenine1519-N6)-dimethyltransferase